MKNITVSVDDELYRSARREAARRRTSVSALVREYLAGLRQMKQTAKDGIDPELARLFAMSDRLHRHRTESANPKLQKLWDLADSKPSRAGSVGPLNRDELYQREFSR